MPVSLAVVLGGALGALARYGLDGMIERRTFSVFPWSTFAINVSGCFVAGAVVAALVDRHHLPPALRIGLVVGFLGAYTTFDLRTGDRRPCEDARIRPRCRQRDRQRDRRPRSGPRWDSGREGDVVIQQRRAG